MAGTSGPSLNVTQVRKRGRITGSIKLQSSKISGRAERKTASGVSSECIFLASSLDIIKNPSKCPQ